MAKIIQRGGQNKRPEEDRRKLEGQFRRAIAGLGRALQLPPTPEPPANLFSRDSPKEMQPEDRRAIWELQQDVKVLQDRYNLCVKVAWRTSAALLGLAAPLFGSDLLSKLINLLGG